MQAGDSKGKSMSPKTPQRVFLAEAESMPLESVHLKLQLSNNQSTRFDKEPLKNGHSQHNTLRVTVTIYINYIDCICFCSIQWRNFRNRGRNKILTIIPFIKLKGNMAPITVAIFAVLVSQSSIFMTHE